ncbi:uncharacterized protein TM35_000141020 [Trypanosoma theileri]|uniref:Uncharacterized protein n=1 Tax=Trypanosoma theileri TaxID=67003 RepID=A0A1X0NW93_9TRYP|nr:uncharacterized protein TM35_000141020 [Trypanosoma theileri]ORC88891.1 hypothetical protein TM35_000141020 [Trypanosoma theileri]
MESYSPIHYTSIPSSLNNCPISSLLLFHTPLGCPVYFLFCCRLIAIPQFQILSPTTAVYTPIRMSTTQPHHFHSKPETNAQTEGPIANIISMETQSIQSDIINTLTHIYWRTRGDTNHIPHIQYQSFDPLQCIHLHTIKHSHC